MRADASEQELLDFTVDLAMRMRWAVFHPRPARTATGWRTATQGHKGFPDLTLARSGVVLFRELKGYDTRGRLGRLSPEQRDWGRQIAPHWPYCTHLDFEVLLPNGELTPRFDVWTPTDVDLIVATLTARTTARTA